MKRYVAFVLVVLMMSGLVSFPVFSGETLPTEITQEGENTGSALTVNSPPESGATQGGKGETPVLPGNKRPDVYVTVTFEAQNGAEPEKREVKKGEAIGKLPVPVKEKAEFIGWYKPADNAGAAQAPIDEKFVVNEDITLYAAWETYSNGSNPDHLAGPQEANPFPIIKDTSADPYLGEIQPKAMRSRGSSRSPEPGAVELTKTVEPVEGFFNTFRVTLRMEATDKEQKNDIVLVIDTSGSMSGSRIENAKAAAKQFVNQLLDEGRPNTRIALVSFASQASLEKDFKNYQNKQELIGAIDALSAGGGTFTQAGLKTARDKLASSQADFKNMVFLSDGEPTYAYKINNPDNYLSEQYIGTATPGVLSNTHTVNGTRKATTGAVPVSEFNYGTTVGEGYSMFHRYHNPIGSSNDKYYNLGNSAVAEAGFAKNAGIKIHSIAMGAGALGEPILQNVASPGHSHATDDPTALSGIFAQIAASIASAMQNANVTDPMGVGFEVKGGTASDIQVTQGTATLTGNTISWDVGTLTESVPGNPMTRFAQMTYDVEVNDGILDVVSSTGNYNTNNGASVSYTDINGNQQTKNFPEPTAEPLIVGIYKVLLDSQGNIVPDAELGNRKFTVNVKFNEGSFDKNYEVEANKSGKVMTDIKVDKTYTIEETSTAGISTDLGDYESSIRVERFDGAAVSNTTGTSLGNFEVPKNPSNDKPYNTKIIFINKEKADGQLTIKKEIDSSGGGPARALQGRANRSSNLPAAFKFKVKGVGYDGNTVVYENNDVSLAPGASTTLEGLPYGTYTVMEIDGDDYEADDYSPAYSGEGVTYNGSHGTVKISIDHKTRTMTVTNTPQYGDEEIEFWAIKKWVGGPAADHDPGTNGVTWKLYADGVLLDEEIDEAVPATELPTSASGTPDPIPNATAYKWKNLPKYKADGSGQEIVYTAKEDGVVDGKVTVNGNTYTVEYGSEYLYSQYKGEYDEYHCFGARIITNTYTQPQTDEDVKATKTWTDADGYDPKPEIKFELWRKNGTAGEGEKVVDATALTNDEVNFGKQLKTDLNGVEYSYFVKEIFTNAEEKDNWTITGDGSELTVDNKLKPEDERTGQLTISKVLLNEPQPRSNAPAALRGEPLKFKFKVTGPGGYLKEFELKAGEEKVLTNLLFGKYKVVETETHGFEAVYQPDDEVILTKNEPQATITVENGNYGGTGLSVSKTVEKVWVNGPKPTVTIELWRKGQKVDGTAIDEKVPEVEAFVVPANASGEQLKMTFAGLTRYDPSGREFEYYAKEPTVPENYEATYSEDKLTVTNTYIQPQTDEDVKATKTWTDADGYDPKPEIKFELWRKNGTAGEGEKVVDATALTNDEVNFGKQLKTDLNGVEYAYFVKEIFTNAEEKDNWTITGEDGLAVTNTLKALNDRDGKLTVKKELKNEQPQSGGAARGLPLKFKFTITGPGLSEEFELKAGEEKAFEHLLYGKYKITETESHGFAASYDPAGGEVTLTKEAKEATVTVTNTNDGGAELNVSKTIEKRWTNGGPRPSTTLELWRKGQKADGTAIDEKAGELKIPAKAAAGKLKKTFENLPKYDPSGREYEYYVKEPKVPESYKAQFKTEGDSLIVINKYKGVDLSPKTGDTGGIALWTWSLSVSAAAFGAALVMAKKRSGKKEGQ